MPQVKSDIYAVVIESLYHAWNQQKQRYEETPPADQKQLFAEINAIKQMNLPIIIIDYLPPYQRNQAASLASNIAQQGMIPWITNNALDQIYINKIQNVKRDILILVDDENNTPTRFTPAFMILGYDTRIPGLHSKIHRSQQYYYAANR